MSVSTESGSSQAWKFLERAGIWFWILAALGLLARAFLVLSTQGTADVSIWSEHAQGVVEHGLLAHYRKCEWFNHPPFVSWVMSELWKLSGSLGLSFPSTYRALVALSDVGSAFLLLRVMKDSRWRWLAVGLYCIAPAALIFSAHHGNTDSILAPALLACCLLAGAGRPIACGAVLGLSLWIKLPSLVAAPALGFAFPRRRDRILCALTTLLVGAASYIPALAQDFPLVWSRIFGYRGLYIHTLANPPIWIWGLKNFCFSTFGGVERWPAWAVWRMDHANAIALVLVVLYAFLRRRERTALGVAQTIAGCFAIFYGMIEAWAFQYFAWSVPFWFVRGPAFGLCANLLGGGYIYGLYAFVCEDAFLRAVWNFNGHPLWPEWLIFLRDGALIGFLVFGGIWIVKAMAGEIRAWRTRDR